MMENINLPKNNYKKINKKKKNPNGSRKNKCKYFGKKEKHKKLK